MKTRILLVGLLVFLALSYFSIWWRQSTRAVNPQNDETKIFVVLKGESIRQIARRLQDEGLIRSKLAFFLLVKQQGAEKTIQAGTFRLSPSMKPEIIIKELSHGTLDVWITTVEGWRKEEVAEYLRKALPETSDYQSDARYLMDPYLSAVIGHEGYLFPDTYLVPKNSSALAVINILLSNFDKKVDKTIEGNARKVGLTREQVVILASIIEREAKYDSDRPIVAGILLNRLREGILLQTDATVQYTLGYQTEGKTWWKKVLTPKDLQIDSPYNTYLHVGLPPAPISSPGLASLIAASNPSSTDYLYYLSDKSGKMHYAKTLEEHNKNIRKYLPN